MSKQPKRYGYVRALILIDSQPAAQANASAKRILRKLVRDAVGATFAEFLPTDEHRKHADRIAKELVP